jgi:hypothetical protein
MRRAGAIDPTRSSCPQRCCLELRAREIVREVWRQAKDS